MTDTDGLKDYVQDYCEPLTEACRQWALIIIPGTLDPIKAKRKKRTQRSIIHDWAVKIAHKHTWRFN